MRRKDYPRRGVRIATAGVRTGFAMTGFLHGVWWIFWWCVGEGLCPSRGRGRTPPLRMVSRNAVGRATARVAPTEWLVGADDSVRPVRYKECGAPKRLSPQGSTDCHSRCTHRLRNDRLFTWGVVDFLVVRRGGALPLPRAG